jgi:DNA-binding GntR family transcriptional regulator
MYRSSRGMDEHTVVSSDRRKDRIHRDARDPAYLQLSKLLRQKIGSGQILPGEQLPSESELRKQYSLSQMTVRRAINILQEQGVVTTSQGKGTFVRSMKLGMGSFPLEPLHDLFSDKKRVAIKLLEVDLVFADERTASRLSVSTEYRVVYIRSLICRDGAPALLHTENLVYDPTRPLVESEMGVTSLDGLFSGNGHTDFKKGELSVHAAVAGGAEAELLQVPVMSPAFRLEHLFYDFADRIVSWGQFLCRGDLLHFSTRVGLW